MLTAQVMEGNLRQVLVILNFLPFTAADKSGDHLKCVAFSCKYEPSKSETL